MSLDFYLEEKRTVTVFDANITHNLGKMADAAGIYKHLWRPEEIGIKRASQLIEPLTTAIKDMEERPEYYKTFDSPNLWGTYNNFLPWLKNVLQACTENPTAKVRASR